MSGKNSTRTTAVGLAFLAEGLPFMVSEKYQKVFGKFQFRVDTGVSFQKASGMVQTILVLMALGLIGKQLRLGGGEHEGSRMRTPYALLSNCLVLSFLVRVALFDPHIPRGRHPPLSIVFVDPSRSTFGRPLMGAILRLLCCPVCKLAVFRDSQPTWVAKHEPETKES